MGLFAEMQREAERRRRAEIKEARRIQREQERAQREYEKQVARDEKERKRLYLESRVRETDSLNRELEASVSSLEGLLTATLDVDDYIDLDREEREREAREDFDVLQHYMPKAQRDLVEQVCVASRPINPVSIPVLKTILQYFFEIFRDDKNYRSKRSKKLGADAPKIKFYKPKKDKAKKLDKPVENAEPPKRVDVRKVSYMQTLRILRPDLDDE